MADELTVEALDRELVEAARRRAGPDKLRDGLVLSDRTHRIMIDGIRSEQPAATSSVLLQILRERLRLARTLERR